MKRGSTKAKRKPLAVVVEPVVRPLTAYAQSILKAIPFAPDDIPSWQIDSYDYFAGRRVSAALQQLKRRGLIVVSERTSRSGKRWQRPNTMVRPTLRSVETVCSARKAPWRI